jgi:hypothetical protein
LANPFFLVNGKANHRPFPILFLSRVRAEIRPNETVEAVVFLRPYVLKNIF